MVVQSIKTVFNYILVCLYLANLSNINFSYPTQPAKSTPPHTVIGHQWIMLNIISFKGLAMGPYGALEPLRVPPHHCNHLGCVYLAAAASQSSHLSQRPPSASSPAPWSVFPLRLLQPPSSYCPRLETPLLGTQVAKKKEARSWSHSRSPTFPPVASSARLMDQHTG